MEVFPAETFDSSVTEAALISEETGLTSVMGLGLGASGAFAGAAEAVVSSGVAWGWADTGGTSVSLLVRASAWGVIVDEAVSGAYEVAFFSAYVAAAFSEW